jgi:predicted RNase H-like HicB family nuclease
MKKVIQVRISRGDEFYVAECLDLPVVTQAKTLDELADNLREAIALQLEGEDPSDFGLEPNPAIIATLELDAAISAKT